MHFHITTKPCIKADKYLHLYKTNYYISRNGLKNYQGTIDLLSVREYGSLLLMSVWVCLTLRCVIFTFTQNFLRCVDSPQFQNDWRRITAIFQIRPRSGHHNSTLCTLHYKLKKNPCGFFLFLCYQPRSWSIA